MSDIKKYNLFILLATFARTLVELFSAVLLYDMGYSIRGILLFYSIMYFTSIFVNTISLYLSSIIDGKYILIFSNIIYSIAFYYLSTMTNSLLNLIIFAILLAIGGYTFHSMRHLYAINSIKEDKRKTIGNILIFTYIAIIISSYIGPYITNNFGLMTVIIILIITSLMSIIPIFLIKKERNKPKIKLDFKSIKLNQLLFFIFEQFKVVFLLLQPLFIYIYIDSNIEYIGIFNVILGISSIIFIYLFVRYINERKIFWLLNLLFAIVLVLKINIIDKNILLIIAFFEGLGTKMFEIVSTENIYNNDTNDKRGYLVIVEFIFCFISSLIFFIFFLFNIDLKLSLYISIIGIVICGFVRYLGVKSK